jgi:hypothetical protein
MRILSHLCLHLPSPQQHSTRDTTDFLQFPAPTTQRVTQWRACSDSPNLAPSLVAFAKSDLLPSPLASTASPHPPTAPLENGVTLPEKSPGRADPDFGVPARAPLLVPCVVLVFWVVLDSPSLRHCCTASTSRVTIAPMLGDSCESLRCRCRSLTLLDAQGPSEVGYINTSSAPRDSSSYIPLLFSPV